MSFSKRLKQAMQEKGFTQGSLAEAVGMAQSSVWRLTSGGASGTKKLIKIAKVLGVNPEWLSDGTGTMKAHEIKPNNPLIIDSILDYTDKTQEYDKDNIVKLRLYNRIEWVLSPSVKGEKDTYSMFLIPKNIIQETNSSIKDSISIIAPDDSMSPIIQENSTVALDTSIKDIKNGKIYLVFYGGVFMIRALYSLPENKIKLKNYKSDDYPEFIVSASELLIIDKVYYVAGKID
ncbi:HTH-type transcriptional regulator PrtR [Arsenophonus endosymbiont of Aleurodicus floccissimus]|uniref:XRE family transcriptional regulator n=1 Tax=Arsenophonus endosymbiont of Aleurodicus floccissimus TaxID=2152761 RepID=UPI000E6B30AA|nr:helix-turn-helix domain-containing protein [Arsenophonus endosymbiont of Aleurodicus floccissimus]SPP31586.1 HTH-type transcriptional regulator PrtR [Arsenophonus endosymbiont of Aleurodicus floccissimus]